MSLALAASETMPEAMFNSGDVFRAQNRGLFWKMLQGQCLGSVAIPQLLAGPHPQGIRLEGIAYRSSQARLLAHPSSPGPQAGVQPDPTCYGG